MNEFCNVIAGSCWVEHAMFQLKINKENSNCSIASHATEASRKLHM